MLVVLGIFSAGLLGLIIYFAVSPKSSRPLRLAALGALGLIGLSLVVCGIIIIRGPGEDSGDVPLPAIIEVQPQKKGGNLLDLIVFFAIFLLVLALIIYATIKNKGKKDAGSKKSQSSSIFSNDDQLNIHESDDEENEDSFEIETK